MDFTVADSALLVVDVQEKFLPVIPAIGADQPIGRNCRILTEGAAILGVHTLISEQYPKGLGPTLPHLVEVSGASRLPKSHFSCCGDDAIAAQIRQAQRGWWVLCGVEAHVCVRATAADLLAQGRKVVIAGDAVASRRDASCALALDAARDLGALVLPTETILFRWLRQAKGESFKRISALVR